MRLLRGADFRNLWLGQTVSLFGDQVTLIALPLAAVLVLDADAAEMGYLTPRSSPRISSSRCPQAPGSSASSGGAG